ncbi:hypothetical protein Salat_0197000 [Sesamum alatum]|uniref:Late embryogenesis abundant protein LEA-2 subgroup domain-containing protein n=1 Tax=Sesamum alatum TaxID=300844 RepID=A0AAE1YXU4_9LAMI|nr:hypothetical protein Salat_0197000 [Sesamum alatum]
MGKKVCICILLLLILTAPIVIFSLTLVTHKPKFYIEDLYIPALNNSTQSNATRLNTFIFFDLKLQNVMPFNGLRYGDVNLTFFYGSNRSLPIAGYTVLGFYQGHKKTAHKRAVVRTRGLPWEDAFGKVSGGSTVAFGVDLATTVKLRRCGFYTKRKAVVAAADVHVGASGEELHNKIVKLH